MKKETSLDRLIIELNRNALLMESPEKFVKWAIGVVFSIVKCEFAAVSVVSKNSVGINVGSNFGQATPLVSEFKNILKFAIRSNYDNEFVCYSDKFYRFRTNSKHTKDMWVDVRSFYFLPLKIKNELIGFVAVGTTTDRPFSKSELSKLEEFSKHLSLGLRSLVNRAMVLEQSRILEEEKKIIEEENELIDAIVGGMREGLLLVGSDDNIIAINDAAEYLLGISKTSGAKQVHNFIISELVGGRKTKGSVRGATEREIIVERPHKMIIHISVTPIFDKSNRLIGRSILVTDITREKEIEQMKSDFVGLVSHELRTPLAAIREAVSLMNDEVVGPVNEKQKKCLSITLKEADRLARIIDNILDLAKIESGKLKLRVRPERVKLMVDQVLLSMEPKIKANGVKVLVRVSPKMPRVLVDRDQIVQVFTNLLGNALKFTPRNGSITISAMYEGESGDKKMNTKQKYIVASVADTGPGISKSDQKKLFKKFSQLSTGLSRQTGGSGLGLVISKEIISKHGGTLWVESDHGQGATFSFTLPVA